MDYPSEENPFFNGDFQQLVDGLGVGVFLIQDGLLKYVNPRMTKIFGYEMEEMRKPMPAAALAHPQDWPLIEENLKKSAAGEVDSVYFRFRGGKKSGDVIFVEVYCSRIPYGGRPAVMGTLVDITDRVRGREDLEIQVKKFQALYELALAMVGDRTLDENLTLIVDKSRELLGTDTAWIALHDHETRELCWHISSGLQSPDFKYLRVPMGEGLAGKVAESGHWLIVEDYYREIAPEFHAPTRSEGLISGIAVPVQIGESNFGVLFAFNRTRTKFSNPDLDTLSLFGNLAAVEITRKRAMEVLSESEQRYKALFRDSKRQEELYQSFLSSTVDAIIIFDSGMKVQYVNPSFGRIFGWTLQDLKNGMATFLADLDSEVHRVITEDVLGRSLAVSGFETKCRARDGSSIDVSISASPYHDADGGVSGLTLILRDISLLKTMDRAKERVVNHLSHEIVTPIFIIQAALKRLKKKELRDDQKRKVIERAQRNLDRLVDIQAIVQDIAVPKLYQPQAFQVDSRIEGILDKIREESSHRNVALVPRLTAVYTDIIDPEILERTVWTLVKNAIENTPDEGQVTISLLEGPEGLSLIVADHGIGIDRSDQDMVLKGFYHTQETAEYATMNSFDFGAGGKGLELMRLKLLADEGIFRLSFETTRCRYLMGSSNKCPGAISACPFAVSPEDCARSGGTVFTVRFSRKKGPL
jgi:PAS domain S-box-containing protein